MKKRKIIYVTGTRAEYGVMYNTLMAIHKHQKLDLGLIVTGMHISKDFGYTIKRIKKDPFKIVTKIDSKIKGTTGGNMAMAFGTTLIGITKALEKIKPDILLIEGDRGEALAGAIAGAYMNIPVVHVSGGDVSGSIDNSIRQAITIFAHIHLPGTKKSAERIIKSGEEVWRVHMVGNPGIDLKKEKIIESQDIVKEFNLNLDKPKLLVVQHPVTQEWKKAGKQMRETMDAIAELKMQTILIYPNADAGGKEMIKVIKKYEDLPFLQTYITMSRMRYLSLLNVADLVIGNSSSAIVEAPCFGLCAINIGTRQRGREKANNIVDIGYDRKEIVRAVKSLLAKKNANIKRFKSPYKDVNTEKKIVDLLCKLRITPRMLEKKIVFG